MALIAAILAHVMGLGVLELLAHAWPATHRPNLVAVIQLLGGFNTPAAAQAPRALGDHPFCIGAYISLLTVAMWFIGKRANKVLRDREQADWFRLLRPAGVGFVVLTADFVMGGETVLYKGVVKEFRIAKTGELERVVLRIAARKPLSEASQPSLEARPPVADDPGQLGLWPASGGDASNQALGYGWTEIPGEAVVLQMKDAKTVNLDYFWTSDGVPLEGN
ncbi:hypothetical protein [Xanthomonas hortorum]|uniref:hypothetical protein n=1 Tax=Xanthomonas hortorum TaxID=56454 RepID=UPI001594E0C2|nr:hypothetical protein [Xanthomonas hortorum]NHF65287.1 hypothetical protein [Xanthomonas hortorum]